MNIIFRKLKALRNIVVQNFRWQMDSILCRKELKPKDLLNLDNKRIVVLAPHSDDEWIGCCGLLTKYPNNVTVINMDMPGGDRDDIHQLRFMEMQNVANELGYELITISKNKEEFLRQFMTTNSVEIVMLPCYYDWHDEHFEVMEIFSRAAEKSKYDGLVGMYQVSFPIPAFMINYASCMQKNELKKKWREFKKYYPTQTFLPTKRFMLNERINGGLGTEYAIECYSVMHIKSWQIDYICNRLSEDETILLKSNLNNIAFVRDKLQQKRRNEI